MSKVVHPDGPFSSKVNPLKPWPEPPQRGRTEWNGIKLECPDEECFVTVHSEMHSRPSANCKKGNCECADKFREEVLKHYVWSDFREEWVYVP